MRALWLAAALLPLGSPLLALSCVRPDAARAYAEAAASEDVWMVLKGTLAFDASAMPAEGFGETGAEPPPVPATFEGEALGPDGWVPAGVEALTVRPLCAGPWCGTASPGPALLFAHRVGEAWEVEVGPCGGLLVPDPDPATLAAVEACAAGPCP